MYIKSIGHHFFNCFTKQFHDTLNCDSVLQTIDHCEIQQLLAKKYISTLEIIITVTTRCDLQCEYCFENISIRESMSVQTLNIVLESIEKYLILNSINTLKYVIFGGEPLLNEEVVLLLSSQLYNMCKKHNVKLVGTITTNGYIYNEYLFAQLSQNGVHSVQLTFDGDESVNNSSRRVSDSGNLYTTALKNIENLSKYFSCILVKYNITENSYKCYDNFLNDLDLYRKNANIIILLEAIKLTQEYKPKFSYEDNILATIFVNLIELSIAHKYRYITKIFTTPCMDMKTHSYMVDIEGNTHSSRQH